MLNLSLMSVGDIGLVKKSVVDGINGVEAVFTCGRDLGTNGTEDTCTVWSAEAAGELLFQFNHTHIAFDQVVVQGDAEVIHEG